MEIEDFKQKIITAAPLDLAKLLEDAELYDMKETTKVIDNVYKQFENSINLEDEILIPVFTSIVDGFLEMSSATRKMRKKGLKASRIVNECRSFRYDDKTSHYSSLNPYDEYKSAREYTTAFGENDRISYTNNRKVYDDDSKSYYKERAVADNGEKVNLIDEYTGLRNITPYKNQQDKRRNDPQNRMQGQPDHIVPLAKVHEYLKCNYGLSDEDIAVIANSDDNLAMTAARINQGESGKGGKKDMTNSEFVADQRKRAKEGIPNLGLSEDTLERMLQMEKDSKVEIDNKVNQTVLANLSGKGIVSDKEYKQAYKDEEQKKNKSLTLEEKIAIDKKLSKKKQEAILGKIGENAIDQAKDYLLGNIFMFLVKPLYFEINDMIRHGIRHGVDCDSVSQAFSIRFTRIKEYTLKNVRTFVGDNFLFFVKGLISSIIEGVISLFVGIFKQILKLVKEGIKIFTDSCKILFGAQSKNLTQSQKGDAIIKILGGSVIAISGIGIEALINRLGIPDPWSVIISTTFSGIASALFMLLLNKLDLFSVVPEKRAARICDIFGERIKSIKAAFDAFNIDALEVIKTNRLEYDELSKLLHNDLKLKDDDSLNYHLNNIAKFFRIQLPYSDLGEFTTYLSSHPVISL